MKKQIANFEIVRSHCGWYIIKQVYTDGGKLIIEAAQNDNDKARQWVADYCKKWDFKIGEIAIV